jgi:hypothetical protein
MKNIRKAIINSRRQSEWYRIHPMVTKEEIKNEQSKKA